MGEPGATAPHPVLVEAKPSIRSVVHSAVSRATNDDDDDDDDDHHHLHHPHATSSPPRQLTLEHGNGGGGDDDGGVAVAQSCPDMPSETVTEVEIDTEANLRRLQQALPAPAPAGGLHASWTRPAQWNAGSLQRPLPASGADVLRSSWKRPTQCDAGSVQQPLPASGPEALDDASRKRPAPCDAGSLQQPSRASGSDVLEASRRRPRQWNAGAEPEPALLRQPAVPTESRSSILAPQPAHGPQTPPQQARRRRPQHGRPELQEAPTPAEHGHEPALSPALAPSLVSDWRPARRGRRHQVVAEARSDGSTPGEERLLLPSLLRPEPDAKEARHQGTRRPPKRCPSSSRLFLSRRPCRTPLAASEAGVDAGAGKRPPTLACSFKPAIPDDGEGGTSVFRSDETLRIAAAERPVDLLEATASPTTAPAASAHGGKQRPVSALGPTSLSAADQDLCRALSRKPPLSATSRRTPWRPAGGLGTKSP
ncbi:hypothetical protein DCS_03590 [Drechmeria coniospora]|uniref:Uncharacterized protein n=1 Tax=Drechmeria coniospora TaxID=98403 RepID=A0A151GHQ0_DRECN|nr:hypothetical protein DCS_03590 [Drechmeria coniospora]KYK56589.1 hypothetical protein DCS_03590 [Drechmeria coniospora]